MKTLEQFKEEGVKTYFPYIYERWIEKVLAKLDLIKIEEERIPSIERTALNSPKYREVIIHSEIIKEYFAKIKAEGNKVYPTYLVTDDRFYDILETAAQDKLIEIKFFNPKNNLEKFDDYVLNLFNESYRVNHRSNEDYHIRLDQWVEFKNSKLNK